MPNGKNNKIKNSIEDVIDKTYDDIWKSITFPKKKKPKKLKYKRSEGHRSRRGKYYCKYCEYETYVTCNMLRHLTSKLHYKKYYMNE